MDGPGFESRQGKAMYIVSETSTPALGPTQPSIQWVQGLFGGVKRAGHDIEHTRPSLVDVTNEWIYTSTTPICLHGMDRDNFTFNIKEFMEVRVVRQPTGTARNKTILCNFLSVL